MKQMKEHVSISPRGLNASLLTICSQNKLFESEIDIKVEWDKIAFKFAGFSSVHARKLRNVKGNCFQTTVPAVLGSGHYDLIMINEDELICEL